MTPLTPSHPSPPPPSPLSPLRQVLKEYEKTISELIADKERDKAKLEVGFISLHLTYPIHLINSVNSVI